MEQIVHCTNVYERITMVLVKIKKIYPEWDMEVNHYLKQASILKTEMVLGQRDADLTSEQFFGNS